MIPAIPHMLSDPAENVASLLSLRKALQVRLRQDPDHLARTEGEAELLFESEHDVNVIERVPVSARWRVYSRPGSIFSWNIGQDASDAFAASSSVDPRLRRCRWIARRGRVVAAVVEQLDESRESVSASREWMA